jgi:hypothetical protein
LQSPHCNVTISRGISIILFVYFLDWRPEALSASKRGYQQSNFTPPRI